ncbi:MAG: 2-amino-4-hydroxy-6-hydroxymethyldihydropteridine pyrophosphokinase [Syntrophus sp. PtaB.Bin138]|nr:MAG: 2-amino-4-hydroxy-6-hydroxymethyldihydropteridine pyrophosphokinase [Syntrophus sp. PtaB.Bin138]
MGQAEEILLEETSGVICYIGIGSNREGPVGQCLEAVRRIGDVSGVKYLRCSSLYRTEPVGLKDQDDYVNAVVEVRSVLSARELLNALSKIEAGMGRIRTARWGPRIIDLDLLLYGQEVIQESDLVIPHPELHRRRFVLVPLNELASYVIHPGFGVSIRGLMKRLQDESRVERIVQG